MDITYCNGNNCKMKDSCLRYVAYSKLSEDSYTRVWMLDSSDCIKNSFSELRELKD